MKEIPVVKFESSYAPVDGIEIITLDYIRSFLPKNPQPDQPSPETPHRQDFYNLCFYTHGETRHMIDFESYEVRKNSLIYMARNQVHAFRLPPGVEGYCILFTQQYLEKTYKRLSKSIIFQFFAPGLFSPLLQAPADTSLIEYVELFYREFYNELQLNKEDILGALFTVILTKAEQLRRRNFTPVMDDAGLQTFSRFTNLLETDFQKSRNAEYYADKLLVSYKHLNSVCKELMNKTAKRFIDDYIILEARRRLAGGEISVNELAFELGFDEATNFVKFFKKHTGRPPGEARGEFS